MKFLLNANIPPSLGKLLSPLHECRHVSDFGKSKSKDIEIIFIAKENDETIITHDLDYGNLLAFNGFSKPSVIIFRIHRINAEIIFRLLTENWEKIKLPLQIGSIVIIEKEDIRIRKLPIKK